MTILEGVILVIVIVVALILVTMMRHLRKQQAIIDALNITIDFNDEKLKDVGKKYYTLSAEISRTRAKFNIMSQLLEHINISIWQRDADLNIVYTNQEYMRTIGDGDNKPANKIIQLYKDEVDLAKKAIANNQPQTIRKYIISGGERKYFEITEIPLDSDNSGQTFGFATDLSEIDNAKIQLQQSADLQNQLLECATSAIAIYNSKQELMYYNQVFANLWQLTSKFLDSKPSYAEVLEKLRYQGKLPEYADFQAFKKSRLSMFTNLLKRDEDIYYLPDGRTLRTIAIPAEQGGLLLTYKDITDQITLERSYNTLLSVRSQTLDNLTEGIAVFGSNGRLQVHNPIYAKLWQLEDEFLKDSPHLNEILSKNKKTFDKNDNEIFNNLMINIINQRTNKADKIKLYDGTTISWNSVPLPDGDILFTYTDITDSAKVEESLRAERQALREAEAIKNNFLANVSYKLRSPLTSISGFAEMLNAGYFGSLSDKQVEYVQGITSSSNQLATLVDNILDITSIDAGQMVLNINEFNIAKTLAEIKNNAQEYIDKYQLNIDVKCPRNITIMIGDKKRIIQIISNILRNSIRFINHNGNITIKAQNKNSAIIISVEDNGKGIPEKELNSVFEKFNRQTSLGAGETGLGLTIAKSFVELHNGSIEIQSKVGKGTKITCIFPQTQQLVSQ